MSNSFRPWQERDEDTEDPSTPRTDQATEMKSQSPRTGQATDMESQSLRTDQATEMESQSKESQPYWEGMARVDQQLMG